MASKNQLIITRRSLPVHGLIELQTRPFASSVFDIQYGFPGEAKASPRYFSRKKVRELNDRRDFCG
jgi:hypothetical protein